MMARLVVLLTALVLLVCYAPVLRGMFDQWSNDEDMGHGFAVPVVILWIVWRERNRWMNLPIRPNWWGLMLLSLAACLQILSNMGAGLFVGSLAFLVSVAGAVLALGGFAFLRVWTFPLLLALFMLPKLAVAYNQATLPLQLLASRLAEVMLLAGGAAVTRSGNIIDVAGHKIAVAEACNGIRYLLSLGFVALVFAYLSDRKPWMRGALFVASVPVAILANAVRVAASAAMPGLDAGAPHAFSALVLFLLSLVVLLMVRRLLNAARAHA